MKPELRNIKEFKSDVNLTYFINSWCILDAIRTAFILAMWFIYTMCDRWYNRMIENLLLHPIQDRNQEN